MSCARGADLLAAAAVRYTVYGVRCGVYRMHGWLVDESIHRDFRMPKTGRKLGLWCSQPAAIHIQSQSFSTEQADTALSVRWQTQYSEPP